MHIYIYIWREYKNIRFLYSILFTLTCEFYINKKTNSLRVDKKHFLFFIKKKIPKDCTEFHNRYEYTCASETYNNKRIV